LKRRAFQMQKRIGRRKQPLGVKGTLQPVPSNCEYHSNRACDL
jgi:hypothetical protein